MTRQDKQRYLVQAVTHAIDVLEAFKGEKDELGVTELAQILKLPKNNVFRLLATLETREYVEQNKATGSYRLGIKTFELGQVFRQRMGLIKQAHSVLEELESKCNESVYLASIQEGMVVYLDIVETTHSVRIVPKVGKRVPAHCTAVGKAQLAFASRDEVERTLDKSGFPILTPNTLANREAVFANLAGVARRGYSTDNEELELEIKCVGAPVRDYTGRVIAGVCISGPIQRMSTERIERELAEMVMDAAREISRRLGFSEIIPGKDVE